MRRRSPSCFTGLRSGLVAVALLASLGLASAPSWSQPGASVRQAEAGPKWSELTPAQRAALNPLDRDWSSIDADRKQKWIQIAARMPTLPPAERERVQARTTAWTRLAPSQRGH